MSTIVLWILLASGNSERSGLTVVGRFPEQAECQKVAQEIKKQSSETRGFPFSSAICIPAGRHTP